MTENSDISELESTLQRILDESDDSHWFLVTATQGRGLSPEVLQKLNILGF